MGAEEENRERDGSSPPSPPPPIPDSDAPNRKSTGESKIDLETFRGRVGGIMSRVGELEKRVKEITEFYLARKRHQKTHKGAGFSSKEKVLGIDAKKQVGVVDREASCTKRMQELMRQFGTILRQLSQHKWAWPFMDPVDVDGLGLEDYYEVIKKPMDFGTIRNKMDAKDDSGYKNVREIYEDVKLVFANAMAYNDDSDDVYVMAKSLLEKFEERWLQLLPKVLEEETRQKEETTQTQTDILLAQELDNAKKAKETNNEIDNVRQSCFDGKTSSSLLIPAARTCLQLSIFLESLFQLNELSVHLEELKEMVMRNCRKMSTEEKRRIAHGLSRLQPEEIQRALDIITQHDSNFSATPQGFDIDIDAQSDSTLWRLKFFIKAKLELHAEKSNGDKSRENAKRKICDALARTARKRNKKR